MADLDKERLQKITWFAGFALALSAFFLPIINPDIFWHFSAARYMTEHLAVPRADFLSWTMQGREWVDFEWLSQLILYGLYKCGGFRLLLLFKGALLAATVVVSWRTAALSAALSAREQRIGEPDINLKPGVSNQKAPAWLYMPFFAAGIITNSDLRPENFSLLFFALLLYRLERERLKGAPEFNLRAGVLAAVFFALWTNLHAGYLYGLALLLIYFLGGLAGAALPFIYGRSAGLKTGGYTAYLKYAVIGLAATLVNPYGWNIYSVILNHQKYIDLLQEYIQEWNTFDLTNLYQAPYIIALAGVFGLLLWRFVRTRKIVYEHFGALLFFAYESSSHARHIPFFTMTALPYFVAMTGGAGGRAKKYLLPALKGAALLAILLYYNAFVWTQYTGGATLFASSSEGVADFLNANKAGLSGLRLFNYWGWGGFLGYRLYPDYKVFIDGRYLFHEKLLEAVSLGITPEKWKSFTDEYKLDLMVIKLDNNKVSTKRKLPDGREIVLWRPAYLFYLPKKDWAVIYWDYRAAVLVRRGAVSPAWLSGMEYSYFRPADSGNIVLPLLEGEIRLSELDREIRSYLRNNLVYHEGTSVNAEVLNYRNTIHKLCKEAAAKCRP